MGYAEVNKELMSLEPKQVIELFIIDQTNIIDNRLPEESRIIRVTNYTTDAYDTIYFAGNAYQPAPQKIDGSELKGDGQQQPRPIFQVTNFEGFAQNLASQANGFLGAKFTRLRVFSKNLDMQTWGTNPPYWADPNPSYIISKEEYVINRKTQETQQYLQFELVNPLDMESLKLPKRKMFALVCNFDYRNSTGCDYSGVPISDQTNKTFAPNAVGFPTYGLAQLIDKGEWQEGVAYSIGDYVKITSNILGENGVKRVQLFVCNSAHTSQITFKPYFDKTKWVADACSKKLEGCICRYQISDLPFGGFPSLTRKNLQ